MGNTIVSRTYGTLQKARRSARQASYFIKYNLIKALKFFKMAAYILYTLMYRYVNKYYAEFDIKGLKRPILNRDHNPVHNSNQRFD